MTKETLAEKLNGREYGDEITEAECGQARTNRLVVVFGYSDDNVELRGAIESEIGCYEGGSIFLTRKEGVLDVEGAEDCERCRKRMIEDKKTAVEIKILWGTEKPYSWAYETKIPHATFDIMEDGEKFCRGIVFSIVDLPA